MHEYKGFKYIPYDDREDDNIKRFHDVLTPKGHYIHINFSPYDKVSFKDFKLWIDIGCPTIRLDSEELHKLATNSIQFIMEE